MVCAICSGHNIFDAICILVHRMPILAFSINSGFYFQWHHMVFYTTCHALVLIGEISRHRYRMVVIVTIILTGNIDIETSSIFFQGKIHIMNFNMIKPRTDSIIFQSMSQSYIVRLQEYKILQHWGTHLL